MSPREAEQIATRYRDGETIQGLATSTGYSYSRIRTTLLAAGVQLRRKGERTPYTQANQADEATPAARALTE